MCTFNPARPAATVGGDCGHIYCTDSPGARPHAAKAKEGQSWTAVRSPGPNLGLDASQLLLLLLNWLRDSLGQNQKLHLSIGLLAWSHQTQNSTMDCPGE